MYRCRKCCNTKLFEIDYEQRVYGTVPAEWLDEVKDWEADWDSAHDDDGETKFFPDMGMRCAACGSGEIEECEPDECTAAVQGQPG